MKSLAELKDEVGAESWHKILRVDSHCLCMTSELQDLCDHICAACSSVIKYSRHGRELYLFCGLGDENTRYCSKCMDEHFAICELGA